MTKTVRGAERSDVQAAAIASSLPFQAILSHSDCLPINLSNSPIKLDRPLRGSASSLDWKIIVRMKNHSIEYSDLNSLLKDYVIALYERIEIIVFACLPFLRYSRCCSPLGTGVCTRARGSRQQTLAACTQSGLVAVCREASCASSWSFERPVGNLTWCCGWEPLGSREYLEECDELRALEILQVMLRVGGK